jgi:hypothetical protein
MTKTGTPQARRAWVEGAWAYRYPAQVSRHLPLRREQRPTARPASRWKAHVRLGTRARPRRATGTKAQQVVGAMARAWRACLGAMAKPVPVPPHA